MDLKLVYFGADILSQAADPVSAFTPEISELTEDMHRIMNHSKGIGLAAPQVNVSLRIIVVDLSPFGEGPKISLVNPVISRHSEETVSYEEGCLSVPGVFRDLDRPCVIEVRGYSPEGGLLEFKADGMFARVLQHEIDHLDGILFIDHLESYQRKELARELKKIKKRNG
ncbi:MAG: peptide deformylase [Spirochaetota bacterium]